MVSLFVHWDQNKSSGAAVAPGTQPFSRMACQIGRASDRIPEIPAQDACAGEVQDPGSATITTKNSSRPLGSLCTRHRLACLIPFCPGNDTLILAGNIGNQGRGKVEAGWHHQPQTLGEGWGWGGLRGGARSGAP